MALTAWSALRVRRIPFCNASSKPSPRSVAGGPRFLIDVAPHFPREQGQFRVGVGLALRYDINRKSTDQYLCLCRPSLT